MTTLPHSALRRLIAPFGALILTLAVIWWEFPENLPLWRSIGIVTAWGGSGLLVASLMLMVREPHIARLLGGLETMYRWHHRCGVLAYTLLLCHPLALALNGWFESPRLAWQTLAPWEQSWPLWLGWIALILLMFGLITTFALRLPYRLWRNFHITLGFGVLFSLAHVYALLGGAYLLLLMIVVTTLALSWRFIVSDLGVTAYPYQVTQVEHQATGIIEARLAPAATSLSITPGQFVLVAFNDGQHYHGCGEYHPFTVSSIEPNGDLRVTIKALGPCTQRIQSLEPGVVAHLQGPFGMFFAESPSAPQLWVAGGIGITPFMAALRARRCEHPTTLLYLFRHEADAAFLEELTLLAKTDSHLKLITHASDSGNPDFHELLSDISQVSAREVYICGPMPMYKALLPHLQHLGIAPDAIHFDRFDFR